MSTEALSENAEGRRALESVLRNWGFVLAGACAIGMGVWCFRTLIAPGTLPTLDEAMYYLNGLQIWQDVTRLHVYAFARDTYNQQIVPFVGSYLMAVVMLVGGPSLEMARLASLLAGVIGLVMVSLLSAAIAGKERGLAAGLTAAVWGTAPMNLLISSANLLDAYALMFASASLLAAVQFAQRPTGRMGVALGTACALCFMTKYNVGVLLILAILLGLGLVELRQVAAREPQRLAGWFRSPWALLALFAGGPIIFWLSLGGLRSVAAYMRSHAFGPMTLSEQFLYYPKALFDSFFSLRALGLLPLLGLFYWLVRGWTDTRARVPMIFALLSVWGATFHNYKEARLLFAPVAVLVALGAAAAARWVAGQKLQWRGISHAIVLLVCVGAVAAAPGLTRARFGSALVGLSAEGQKQLREALGFIRENVDAKRTVFFLGSSYGGLDHYLVQMWITDPRGEKLADVRELPYPGFPEFKGWGFSTAASPRYQQILESTLVAEPEAELVVVRHSADSAFRGGFYPYMMAWQENYLSALDQIGDWKAAARRKFPIGMEVSIYRREPRRGSATQP